MRPSRIERRGGAGGVRGGLPHRRRKGTSSDNHSLDAACKVVCIETSPHALSSGPISRDIAILAILPAIYRSAFWGIPESAPASAFGVLCGDSQEVPWRVPPRVPGKLGVPQGVLPGVPFLILSQGKALLGALSGALAIFQALSGSLSGALSGNPHKALRKHSPEHFRGFPKKHSCKWPAGSQCDTIAAILHIARHSLREVSTPPTWCDTPPPWYLVSHRHICAIPPLATYRAIIVRYPPPHKNKHDNLVTRIAATSNRKSLAIAIATPRNHCDSENTL